ncbi:MAG: aminotransferase class V-fold PLP-dependent enzyme [Chloroflexi bacterium]|nr:aminotransferase class V-fold PLP-dependent enzyme [Chloroflexota bacterium]
MTQPTYDLNAVRTAFPIAQQITYLNHASISPVPAPALAAMQAVTDGLGQDPMAYFFAPPEENIFFLFSKEIAEFINAADLGEVVGITSTSAAINAVAHAIDWQPGDNVVFSRAEFPSNAYPWLALERLGRCECRVAPPDTGGADLATLEPLVNDHTRVIAVSAVQFLSGHRADLAALGAFCRERCILLVVDAIQAAGHFPIDVQAMQIDVLAAGGQKSLMGPPGQGFLYVRNDPCQELVPATVGPNATEGWEHWLDYDITPRAGAFRFMMGTPNLVGMFGLLESIRFLQELGLANIDAWTSHLSQLAFEDISALGYRFITPTDPAQHGPIVTFCVGDTNDLDAANAQATALYEHLAAANIRVTKHLDAAGAPHLRISTHCYNTETEIRRVSMELSAFNKEAHYG